jgi:hypothetical protein
MNIEINKIETKNKSILQIKEKRMFTKLSKSFGLPIFYIEGLDQTKNYIIRDNVIYIYIE